MILKQGTKVDALEINKFIPSEDIVNRLKEISSELPIPESNYEYIIDNYFDSETTKDELTLVTIKENLTENDLYDLVKYQSSGYYHLFFCWFINEISYFIPKKLSNFTIWTI